MEKQQQNVPIGFALTQSTESYVDEYVVIRNGYDRENKKWSQEIVHREPVFSEWIVPVGWCYRIQDREDAFQRAYIRMYELRDADTDPRAHARYEPDVYFQVCGIKKSVSTYEVDTRGT